MSDNPSSHPHSSSRVPSSHTHSGARGLLVSIEGIDGSGKGTQAALLVERLRKAGLSCELISFPRYRSTRFGREIGRFLNGEFGALDQVSPTLVSLLFAGDRYESRETLLQLLASHDVVVCDRYVASNMAHQGAKSGPQQPAEGHLSNPFGRQELLDWIRFVEFDLFQLPRPDATFLLRVPVQVSQELIARKAQRSYTDLKADLQESDTTYLARVAAVYDGLALHEANWQTIDCITSQQLRTPDEICDDLFSRVEVLLEQRNQHAAVERDHLPADLLPILGEPASPESSPPASPEFLGLASSRKAWIDETLKSWCRRSCRSDLLRAELEWGDLAGRIAPEKSLWKWAWERFQDLVDPLLGLNEANEVDVLLTSGEVFRGFPDARLSQRGMLILYGPTTIGYAHLSPISIDSIRSVQRIPVDSVEA